MPASSLFKAKINKHLEKPLFLLYNNGIYL